MTMSRLADTYQTLASEGAKAFYNGSLTAQIVKDIQATGEQMTLGASGKVLQSCLGWAPGPQGAPGRGGSQMCCSQ